MNKRDVRELLVRSYSKNELITLASDIAGNAEAVFSDGGTIETHARELVDWCERRKRLEILIEQVKRDRPEAFSYQQKPEINPEREESDAIFGAPQPVSVRNESPPNKALNVFLCHSSQDKSAVREMYQRLRTESWIDPWLDEEKLLPGMDWNLAIEMAVETADAVLVFLSHSSVTKEGYVQRELKSVLDIAVEKPEGTIFVIPVRLEDCQLPRSLRAWQSVDIFPLDRKDIGMSRIIDSLKIRARSIKQF